MKSSFNPDAPYEELENLPKEKAVRAIISTSVDEAKSGIALQDNVEILKEALKRESDNKKRTSVTKLLTSRINKLNKEQGNLEINASNSEIIQPDPWERAKKYSSAAKRFARASVACQVMLGFELIRIKKECGYVQGGKRGKGKSKPSLLFKTFEEHVKAELGYSKMTATKFVNMAEGAKRKLKSCYNNLPLLDKDITNYSDEELNLLEEAVKKITDGSTQSDFLLEIGITKAPQGMAAKGGNMRSEDDEQEPPLEQTMEQLAFAMFASPMQDLCQLRSSSSYAAALHALPLRSDDIDTPSLDELENQTESLLTDIREAKKARIESLNKEIANA